MKIGRDTEFSFHAERRMDGRTDMTKVAFRNFANTQKYIYGARSGTMVEALRYKSEGRGIDSQWFHWNISLT
jgi:hypothetical protein